MGHIKIFANAQHHAARLDLDLDLEHERDVDVRQDDTLRAPARNPVTPDLDPA